MPKAAVLQPAHPVLRDAIDWLARRAGATPDSEAVAAGAPPRGPDDLSPRERGVLALLAVGRSNSEIGDALFISKKTALVHVANIKAKLGARSRVEVVTLAIRLNMVEATSSGTLMHPSMPSRRAHGRLGRRWRPSACGTPPGHPCRPELQTTTL